ncbi:hypothetical protein pb186bvf_011572 [Paramecium bursaria]
MQKPFMSLFDDQSQPLWRKGNREPCQPNCMLMRRVKGNLKYKQESYLLNESMLYRVKDGVVKKYLDLNFVILEKTQGQGLGFILTKNKQSAEFITNEQEYLIWMNTLKKYAIQTTFDEDYKLLKIKGEGNFAKVYKAQGKDLRVYAAKVFDKKKFKNLQLERDALKLELSIMRRLNHPGIIRLYEVYENENNISVITDYLEGGELFKYLTNQPQGFSEFQVVLLMFNLFTSLQYLHQLGIIHRDIKPENIIIRNLMNTSDICIADFGLAENYNMEGKYLFKRCGTPGYVAPEILRDQIYDYKVDIFSAGVLMFIMYLEKKYFNRLSGQSPFHSKSKNDIILKNSQCDINFNTNQLIQKVTPEAMNLLRSLLHESPKLRPTATEALNHPWFQRFFAAMIPQQPQNLFTLQFMPQYQQFQDFYNRSIINHSISLSLSSQSNSQNTTPNRSKSNTAADPRTKSNSMGSQPQQTNRQYDDMPIIEEELDLGNEAVAAQIKNQGSVKTKKTNQQK